MNPKVDWFFDKAGKWEESTRKLRSIILGCDLVEDLKWGVPCYTFDKKNIVLIHTFKDYCAVLFFKGALMKDKKKILVQQTENVQAARQIRFTNVAEIVKLQKSIRDYVYEAVEIEESGAKVEYKKTKEFTMPEEFQNRLNKLPALKKAFESLTPGRQRGYLLHFSSAKQAKTRESRIEKCVPNILEGKGLED
jgi:uncharacterized protein YdeI (YjbR/CyaY-like superfamily)